MSGYDGSGISHFLGDMAKGSDHNRHGWYSLGFCFPGDVPDRHVTYRSDGDQEEHIDPSSLPASDPFIELVTQPSLRAGSDERIDRRNQTSYPTGRMGFVKKIDWQSHTTILDHRANVVTRVQNLHILDRGINWNL
jgi:hypothetical protein